MIENKCLQVTDYLIIVHMSRVMTVGEALISLQRDKMVLTVSLARTWDLTLNFRHMYAKENYKENSSV